MNMDHVVEVIGALSDPSDLVGKVEGFMDFRYEFEKVISDLKCKCKGNYIVNETPVEFLIPERFGKATLSMSAGGMPFSQYLKLSFPRHVVSFIPEDYEEKYINGRLSSYKKNFVIARAKFNF